MKLRFCLLFSVAIATVLLTGSTTGFASPTNTPSPSPTQQVSPALAPAPTFPLPANLTAPIVEPPPAGQYVLEFNRSPVVGNRLRLEGIYDEARLWFTRPRNWTPRSVKIMLKFRHSGALYATRSNMTVLVNGTSVGSVPMNQRQDKVASVVFNVPTDLIQDYNEVVVAGLQNNSPTCTQDPFDPSLWSEVLPDSKIVFDFQPEPVTLNFSRYPYPVFDTLSLETNQLAYLTPKTVDEPWLTATSRMQASLGRVADYRALDTRLIDDLDQVKANERLVVIGTPQKQPALESLDLPLALRNNQILDGKQKPLPPDVGILMLTTTASDRVPILIATGNSDAGVSKAVQFLVQSRDQEIGTGHVILVSELQDIEPPAPRDWEDYLPASNSFKLSDLKDETDQPFEDVTVWGSHSPALDIHFRALPDDQFLPGNTITLRYSYGPQVNPLTSLIDVAIDGVALGGRRLSSVEGDRQKSITMAIPEDRIKPNSRLQIGFRLDPRERRSCSRVTDQQLWGTIHADTSFDLKRETAVQLPDLKLLQFGYPFAAPQDLSSTTIALPATPSKTDLTLMLAVSERLGRLSKADSVMLETYRVNQLPEEKRSSEHLIAIGTQGKFPFPEVLTAGDFALGSAFSRRQQTSQIQALPDGEGLVKQVRSPWSEERVVLALSAQTDGGLAQVRNLFNQDSLFFQLQQDTALISANTVNPSPYETDDYTLEFLQQSTPQTVAIDPTLAGQLLGLFRGKWYVLIPGVVVSSLFIYGVAQVYLKRLDKFRNS